MSCCNYSRAVVLAGPMSNSPTLEKCSRIAEAHTLSRRSCSGPKFGQVRSEFGRRRPGLCCHRQASGKQWPNSVHIRRNRQTLVEVNPISGERGPKLAKVGCEFARNRQGLACPICVAVGPNLDKARNKFTRNRQTLAHIDPISAEVAKHWSKSGQIWSSSAYFARFGRNRPSLAEPKPNGAGCQQISSVPPHPQSLRLVNSAEIGQDWPNQSQTEPAAKQFRVFRRMPNEQQRGSSRNMACLLNEGKFELQSPYSTSSLSCSSRCAMPTSLGACCGTTRQ